MKKVLALLLTLIMVLALCACGSAPAAPAAEPAAQEPAAEDVAEGAASLVTAYAELPTEGAYLGIEDLPEVTANSKYKVGLSMRTVSTDWFKTLSDKIETELQAAGCETVVAICEDDVATQISQLENFMAMGVDAVIMNPCSTVDAVTNIMTQLAEAGIPVITVDNTPADNAPVLATVAVDAYKLGYGVGSYLATTLLEKYPDAETIDYALIGGVDGDSIAHNRNEGAKAGIADVDKDGKMKLVSFLYSGGYSEENGLVTAQNMITANPDLKCIVGTCDPHVIGASQAMTALGMDPANIIMGAVDGSNAAMDSIKNGGSIVCTGMNDTNSFAVLSTRMLVAFLNDGTMPVSRNIIQNPIICTSENVDQYYAG